MAITDFNAWFLFHGMEDYNDVYCLYRSVYDVDQYGIFSTVKGRTEGTYFVKSTICDDTLMLASEKARDAFLSTIRIKFCDDMDIEAYYAIHREMEKND